jgi:hypothetical protein
MEAASGINVRVQQEERIDGEAEETFGKKESCQGEDQNIAQENSEEDGKEDGNETDCQSGAKEKNECGARSVQTRGNEKGRP